MSYLFDLHVDTTKTHMSFFGLIFSKMFIFLRIIPYSVFLSALGEREDAFGNLHRPWKRPPYCTAVD